MSDEDPEVVINDWFPGAVLVVSRRDVFGRALEGVWAHPSAARQWESDGWTRL